MEVMRLSCDGGVNLSACTVTGNTKNCLCCVLVLQGSLP